MQLRALLRAKAAEAARRQDAPSAAAAVERPPGGGTDASSRGRCARGALALAALPWIHRLCAGSARAAGAAAVGARVGAPLRACGSAVTAFGVALILFSLASAERVFVARFMYSKYFAALTSARRARRHGVPFFSLKNVENIKIWLALRGGRGYLKQLREERAADAVVDTTFWLSFAVRPPGPRARASSLSRSSLALIAPIESARNGALSALSRALALTLRSLYQVLVLTLVEFSAAADARGAAGQGAAFPSKLLHFELLAWLVLLSTHTLRYLTLGSRINENYHNTSVLLVEMINGQLRLLDCADAAAPKLPKATADHAAATDATPPPSSSPHATLAAATAPPARPHRSAARTGKRERLQASQAVLKLALKLLRELESPNQISGLSMNPLFYNGVKIVVVSALSAALSEALGIDLKVWKLVKLK